MTPNWPEILGGLSEMREAATAGEWTMHPHAATAVVGRPNKSVIASTGGYSDNQADPDTLTRELECNAAFIAAAANLDWKALREEVERLQAFERAALDAVPTNWLDPILTGPDNVVGDKGIDGLTIERVLRAVRARIAALSPAPTTRKEE